MARTIYKEIQNEHTTQTTINPGSQGLIKAIAALAAVDNKIYEELQTLGQQNTLKLSQE